MFWVMYLLPFLSHTSTFGGFFGISGFHVFMEIMGMPKVNYQAITINFPLLPLIWDASRYVYENDEMTRRATRATPIMLIDFPRPATLLKPVTGAHHHRQR
jgi:hypothetical protein